MSRRNTSLSLRGRSAGGAGSAGGMAVTRGEGGAGPSKDQALGKVLSCSTPEPHRQSESPSCDSDSEAASPVPFLCTQDGSYGDTDVVWNYYTPRADERRERETRRHGTPLSRKSRKIVKTKIEILERVPKKKPVRDSQKKTQLFRDLFELNQNVQEFLTGKPDNDFTEIKNVSSEEDLFNSSGSDRSPKSDGFAKSNSRCLRKNLLSSKFSKPEPEQALESDDSMNECLMRASQMVEEKVFSSPTTSKRPISNENKNLSIKKFKLEQDSMDSIFNNIQFDSPVTSNVKKNASFNNDSFDNLVENLNDSVLKRLTQLPIKNESPKCVNSNGKKSKFVLRKSSGNPSIISNEANTSGWTIKELIAVDSVPSPKSAFGRHSSMPESPTVCRNAKPSSSGTAFSRHNSMPWNGAGEKAENNIEDSPPLRCTPEEIRRKHQQAREKLLAKRLFPLTNTQQAQECSQELLRTQAHNKVPKFQPKFPSKCSVPNKNNIEQNLEIKKTNSLPNLHNSVNNNCDSSSQVDLKGIIEKKRKEAMLKLRRKRSQNNIP